MIWLKRTALGIFIGFVIGFNVGGQGNTLDNLWPKERDGLRRLNEAMRDDKSRRLGAGILTEKGFYSTQSISQEEWRMVASFEKVKKDPK